MFTLRITFTFTLLAVSLQVGQTRMAKCRDGFEKRTLRFSTAGSQFGFYVKPRSRGIEARDALQGSKKTYEIARNTSFTVKSELAGQKLFYMRQMCVESFCNDRIVIHRFAPPSGTRKRIKLLGKIYLNNKQLWNRACFFVNTDMLKLKLTFEPSQTAGCSASVREVFGKACVELPK